jgi:hypothetical protein
MTQCTRNLNMSKCCCNVRCASVKVGWFDPNEEAIQSAELQSEIARWTLEA